jgi:hypothetical protein
MGWLRCSTATVGTRKKVSFASFILTCSLIQKHAAHAYHGRWIFKGYIHERSLVGRWRETGTAVDQLGYEGGFVLCKADETSMDVV